MKWPGSVGGDVLSSGSQEKTFSLLWVEVEMWGEEKNSFSSQCFCLVEIKMPLF